MGGVMANRASIVQRKTGHPVQFEITAPSRTSLQEWINSANLKPNDYIFRSRSEPYSHISTRQYARLVKVWARSIGLYPKLYGTHSLRRTKAALIYKQSKNLRADQLLLGHTKLESTVKYLGIEVDDALELAEKTEILSLKPEKQQILAPELGVNVCIQPMRTLTHMMMSGRLLPISDITPFYPSSMVQGWISC